MSLASPSPRSEPLLWLQLLGLALVPLEALLLLLLLGAGDPGPLPLLERSFCGAIGVLAPAVLLWRLPADPWSLLVVQVPLRGRREIQQRLCALLPPTPLRLASLVGVALLSLVLLWWCDDHAAFASAFSPVAESPRLVGLLLGALLLALLQWQGQQVVQALWLLGRSPQEVGSVAPMPASLQQRERLSPGVPLLLLPALHASAASAGRSQPANEMFQTPEPDPAVSNQASSPEETGTVASMPSPSAEIVTVAVEPEQPPEEQQGTGLDQQIG